jgi:hypothetical protein
MIYGVIPCQINTAADMTMWDINEILEAYRIWILHDKYEVSPSYVNLKVTAFEDSSFS